MVERTAVDVEQRAVPHIAEPVPNHISKARIGDRVDPLRPLMSAPTMLTGGTGARLSPPVPTTS